ncbi:FAD-dependent oxidoreductase [Nocardia sp. CA-136227]|uniref:FAD-dependent oxidoreductase n=1 Tax=Nocardia sp. CA-136227 TaxID=3239979 RepID=UPI003D97ED37
MSRPLRVAVVGAGPAGMYAAGHLLEGPAGTYLRGRTMRLSTGPVEVDMFDRLATPWGLVRHGVAPDHPDKKQVQRVFEEIGARPGFRFFGKVTVGVDISVAELGQWYDAVIFAVGATGDDVRLGIPGEELPGSHSAREFVSWYSGHPDHRFLDVDLSQPRAVIVGNGNVALDIARVLLTPVEVLAHTDIADHALETLRDSKVREVVVLGRRGYRHAAFHAPELSELGELAGVDVVVEYGSDTVDYSDSERRSTLLRGYAERPEGTADRKLVLRFLGTPVAVQGDERVSGLRVANNRWNGGGIEPTGVEETIDAGLVLRAIGYRGTPVPGLPFDEHTGVIPNIEGRVTDSDTPIPGMYVTGWIKRGPRGIIGTNKKCARDTVRALRADHENGLLRGDTTLSAAAAARVVRERCPEVVDWRGWNRIDRHEVAAGAEWQRPRVKLTDPDAQLAIAAGR